MEGRLGGRMEEGNKNGDGTVCVAESGATCQLKLMHSSLVGSAGQVQVDDFMAQYVVIPCREKRVR